MLNCQKGTCRVALIRYFSEHDGCTSPAPGYPRSHSLASLSCLCEGKHLKPGVLAQPSVQLSSCLAPLLTCTLYPPGLLTGYSSACFGPPCTVAASFCQLTLLT